MPIPDNTNKEKLAEVALALLWLSAHGDEHYMRAWKGLDWDVTDLLFEKGWIDDPKNKAKSLSLTDKGKELSEQFFSKHFAETSDD